MFKSSRYSLLKEFNKKQKDNEEGQEIVYTLGTILTLALFAFSIRAYLKYPELFDFTVTALGISMASMGYMMVKFKKTNKLLLQSFYEKERLQMEFIALWQKYKHGKSLSHHHKFNHFFHQIAQGNLKWSDFREVRPLIDWVVTQEVNAIDLEEEKKKALQHKQEAQVVQGYMMQLQKSYGLDTAVKKQDKYSQWL